MNATTRRHGSFIAVAVFAPPFAFAQIPAANSAGDYKKHMDDIQEAKDDLAYAIDDKKTAQVVDAATRLATLLQSDISYWNTKKNAPATELARDTHKLAAQAAQQAQHGDLPAVQTSVVQLQIKCRTCHDSHPENLVEHRFRK